MKKRQGSTPVTPPTATLPDGYLFSFGACTFAASGARTSHDVTDHNLQVEQQELLQWAEAPARQVAYVAHPNFDHAWRESADHLLSTHDRLLRAFPQVTVSTWLGTQIGTGRVTGVYRNNFGARIVSLRIKGSNGAVYVRRYGYDGGNAVTLRKVRTQRKGGAR